MNTGRGIPIMSVEGRPDDRPMFGDRAIRVSSVCILAVGIVLRLHHYVRRDSFWGDEAMLALSICERTVAGLLTPLDYVQAAPVPFLLAERLMFLSFGANELALRLIPLLAGICMLVVFYRLARRLLSPSEALLALGLVATSRFLVQYSVELKPYTVDALVAVVLIGRGLVALRSLDDPTSLRRLTLWGVLALSVSLAAPFVCAGIVVALAIALWERRWRGLLSRLAGLVLAWAIVFVVPYVGLYRSEVSVPYMHDYWAAGLIGPLRSLSLDRLATATQLVFMSVSAWASLRSLLPLYIVLAALGAWAIGRRHGGPVVALIVVPLLACYATSAAGVFPLGTRLVLFLAPSLALLLSPGLGQVVSRVLRVVPRPAGRIGVSVAAVLAGVWLSGESVPTLRTERIRQLVEQLQSRSQPDDAVYVLARLVPGWTYYTTDWTRPDSARLQWTRSVIRLGGPAFTNAPSRGPRPPREGDELVYRARGRVELIGTSSGMQSRLWTGTAASAPDPGWATNEAERIRRFARPCAWVLLADFAASPEGTALVRGIADGGGALEAVSEKDVGLYRVCFVKLSTGYIPPTPSPPG